MKSPKEDTLRQLLNIDENCIHSIYKKMMQDFDDNDVSMISKTMEDGFYHSLYAPGYEDMGVGDIVAQNK